MTGIRQIAFSQGDEFITPQGIIYDASTDIYVRLRRSDTLYFIGTPRQEQAVLGGVTISWIPADQPDFRQRITDWWMNKKEPA